MNFSSFLILSERHLRYVGWACRRCHSSCNRGSVDQSRWSLSPCDLSTLHVVPFECSSAGMANPLRTAQPVCPEGRTSLMNRDSHTLMTRIARCRCQTTAADASGRCRLQPGRGSAPCAGGRAGGRTAGTNREEGCARSCIASPILLGLVVPIVGRGHRFRHALRGLKQRLIGFFLPSHPLDHLEVAQPACNANTDLRQT